MNPQENPLQTTQLPGNDPNIRLYGINFSPYADDQSPEEVSEVPSLAQIRRRLNILRPYTDRIRIYNSSGICEHVTKIALELGYEVSAGAFICPDRIENEFMLQQLLFFGHHSRVKTLIVGNEVLDRRDLPYEELVALIRRVKKACPNKEVTTAVVLETLRAYPDIVREVDSVYVNLHPYFANVTAAEAFDELLRHYDMVKTIVKGAKIIISETGWPSSDGADGADLLRKLHTWATQNQVPYYFFSAFDEPWKAKAEGPWGAHFGLWQNDEQMKPGYKSVFFNDLNHL